MDEVFGLVESLLAGVTPQLPRAAASEGPAADAAEGRGRGRGREDTAQMKGAAKRSRNETQPVSPALHLPGLQRRIWTAAAAASCPDLERLGRRHAAAPGTTIGTRATPQRSWRSLA